jgi:DNA ligase-1
LTVISPNEFPFFLEQGSLPNMAQEASNVMLAQTWEEKIDPAGWWMSEKLDGIRAYWSGTTLYSRNGNTFVAPDYWKKDLPAVALDGELW